MNSEQLLDWCQKKHQSPVYTDYQSKPLIMGILNVTPDSFSDGGRFANIDKASLHAEKLIQDGADIIDIGGESSRPGATRVSSDEELSRVVPIIERIRTHSDIAISIDTYKAEVMSEAVHAGASMINDIKALQSSGAMMAAARLNVPVCLMHMQGVPETMQNNPQYRAGAISEINQFFVERIEACVIAGIAQDRLILDPGFGFGKSVKDNLSIVKQFHAFQVHQMPVLLGASRKSSIGEVLQSPVDDRLAGGLTIAVLAALQNAAIIRTHDVHETYQTLHMLDAIERVL